MSESQFNNGYRMGYGDGANDGRRKTLFWKSVSIVVSAWLLFAIGCIVWRIVS